MTICAVNFFHNLFKKEKPCRMDSDDLIQAFCAKHSLKTSRKKRPITKPEFKSVLRWAADQSNELKLLRNVLMIVFGWLGFLRYDDLSQLQWRDIDLHNDKVILNIKQAKTDRLREGQTVYIPLHEDWSQILNRYLAVSGIEK